MNYSEINSYKFLRDYLHTTQLENQFIDFVETSINNQNNLITPLLSDRLFILPNFIHKQIDSKISETEWSTPVSFNELFRSQYQKLFLLGDPGMGKTTLVRRLATIMSKSGEDGFQIAEKPMIPFPIILRDLDFDKIDSWDKLISAYFKTIPYRELKIDVKILELVLNSGQAFFLFDGLDEIHDPARKKHFKKACEEGMDRYPNCYWWFTSRIIGFNQQKFWSSEEDIPEEPSSNLTDNQTIKDKYPTIYLAHFETAQIKRFMQLWLQQYSPNEKRARDELERFMESLVSNERIRHLAQVPFLLTMIAIYFKTKQSFPDGRIELYRDIIETYLKGINNRRGIMSMHQLSIKEYRSCLIRLAFYMQENRSGFQLTNSSIVSIKEDQAIKIFATQLEESSRDPDEYQIKIKVKKFFNSLHRRSEILVPRTPQEYSFLHLSFQEFFAAEALHKKFMLIRYKGQSQNGESKRDKSFWGNFQNYAQSTSWYETILLFFEGLQESWELEPQDFIDAFEQLFSWNQDTGEIKDNLALLASNILTNEYVEDNFTQVERDATLDWIFIKNPYPWPRGKLREWGSRTGHYFQFSQGSEPKKALEGIRWIESEKNVYEFPKLETAKNCIYLDLSETNIIDISPIRKLKQLKHINFQKTGVRDLAPLKDITEVTELNLSNSKIRNLSPIGYLNNLKKLDLEFTNISDLSILKQNKELQYLYLRGTKIADLSSLQTLSALSKLDLRETNISDCSMLSSKKELTSLLLDQTDLTDISFVSTLANLKVLSIRHTKVESIEPIASLSNLRSLNLSNTSISDFKALDVLAQLENLSLIGLEIDSLKPLYGLRNLRVLTLSDSKFNKGELRTLQQRLLNTEIVV